MKNFTRKIDKVYKYTNILFLKQSLVSLLTNMFFFQHNNESFCIDATQESSRLGRLINHSRKNANLQPVALEFQGKATLVFLAARNIPAGAELLYDYGEKNPSVLSEFPFLKN